MKLKIAIAFVLFSLGTKAQQYQLFSASAEKSIQLKWMSKTMNDKSTFDIYRKENDGSWQKINEKPIAASPVIKESDLNTAKNPFPKDSTYVAYIRHKSTVENTPNKKAFADYTFMLTAIFDNALATHMGIFFEDKTVATGKKYQYKLTDTSQKELSVSQPVSLGELATAPLDFKGTQAKQEVNFVWKVNEEFIGYNIYRNGEKINEDAILPNLEGKSFEVAYADRNLKPGRYTYAIKGVTYLNTESKSSSEILMEVKDLTPPTGVTGFKIGRKGTELSLQWTPSKDKETKGYFIYKSNDRGKTFKNITETMLAANIGQYTEKLNAETTGNLQYYIETQDAAGNKTPSIKTTVYVPDHSAPEMPKSLVSKSESGKIALSWLANKEKDLAGYRIYRGLNDDDENSMLLLNVTPQMATTFIDTFPKKAKTKFIYKVSAMDKAFNESPKANAIVELPDVVPPLAPVLNQAVLNGNEVQLKWGLVVSDAILGYDVYRIHAEKKIKVNATPIAEGNFTDKTISEKGLYQYFVQAVDSARLESKPSNSVYINTSQNKEMGSVKLLLNQDVKTKKVQIEIVGVIPDEVESVQLFRKEGDSGFQILPYKYAAGPFTDETSEPGKIYEYFVEVNDLGDRTVKSETVSFNNP